MPPVEEYRYKGSRVEVHGSEGSLRSIAYPGDSNTFWVRADKLKLVKCRTRKHDVPLIHSDPFVVWLLAQKIYLTGECPEHKLPSLAAAYETATGEAFDRNMVSASLNDKSWGYSLYVSFPEPPADIKAPLPLHKRSHRDTRKEISSNDFVLGLLALGLRFGSNQPLQPVSN